MTCHYINSEWQEYLDLALEMSDVSRAAVAAGALAGPEAGAAFLSVPEARGRGPSLTPLDGAEAFARVAQRLNLFELATAWARLPRASWDSSPPPCGADPLRSGRASPRGSLVAVDFFRGRRTIVV